MYRNTFLFFFPLLRPLGSTHLPVPHSTARGQGKGRCWAFGDRSRSQAGGGVCPRPELDLWLVPPAPPPPPPTGQPTHGVVKQDKSSGGSVDTTKTRSGPQRVRMSNDERPIGAANGKQPNTEALCQAPPPPSPGAAMSVMGEGGGSTRGWPIAVPVCPFGPRSHCIFSSIWIPE